MTAARAIYPDLAGKRVVVTGAGQGIGQAIAVGFLGAGARVTTISRAPLPWSAAEGQLLDARVGDINDASVSEALVRSCEDRGERVDVLVNNAGVLSRSSLLDTDEASFDHVFGVNVRATFFLAQRFARHMRTHGGGTIINAASYAATLASIDHGVYAASKAALVALTRSMAAEWAPYGIRANAFSPGVIPTRMTEEALRAGGARALDAISLRRTGTVAEVADAVLFLASDASSYLTGINLDISGGKLIVQNPGGAWEGQPGRSRPDVPDPSSGE